MDIKELEKWLETDEGKQWGEQYKAPLLSKRNELLAALKEANGKLAEQDLRSAAAAAEELIQERAALSSVLVDREIASLLKNANVFETVIPGTVAAIKETYGIQVKADGPNRIAHGMIQGEDGAVKESSIADIVSAWCKTPEAQKVILNTNNGGGAPGSSNRVVTKQSPLETLSGPALAAMSDAEFEAMRKQTLRGNL